MDVDETWPEPTEEEKRGIAIVEWRWLHPEKVCDEDMTTYSYYDAPEYMRCWNAKVRGFDKCWVHLGSEQKAAYRLMKAGVM